MNVHYGIMAVLWAASIYQAPIIVHVQEIMCYCLMGKLVMVGSGEETAVSVQPLKFLYTLE